MSTRTLLDIRPSAAARLCGVAGILFGVDVMAGWLLRQEAMVRLIPGSNAVSFNAGLLCLLAGLALLPGHGPLGAHWRRWTGALLALVAGLILVENVFDIGVGIDWVGLHAAMPGGNPRPGRLAPNACASFMLLGAALWLADRRPGRRAILGFSLAASATFLLCLTALATYLLNLELLYGWLRFNRMALPTAAAVAILTAGVAVLQQAVAGRQRLAAADEGYRIVWLGTILLLCTGLTAGLTGFAVFLDYQEELAARQLKSLAERQSGLLQESLESALREARLIAGAPAVVGSVGSVGSAASRPAEAQAASALRSQADAYVALGLQSIAFYRPDGAPLLAAGKPVQRPSRVFPVRGTDGLELLWADGFVSRVRVPLRGPRGAALGSAVIERRLDALTRSYLDRGIFGSTGYVLVCGVKGTGVACMPTLRTPQALELGPVSTRSRLPVDDALAGRSGIRPTVDYKNVAVVASYCPIGKTGLAAVVRIDAAEVYQPIRDLLLRLFLTLAGLLVAGVLILKHRIVPLVARLAGSESAARKATQMAIDRETRIRAIVDHVNDGVVSMNADGIMQTFNHAAGKILGYASEEVLGRHFTMLVPERHREATLAGFARYRALPAGVPAKIQTFPMRGLHRDGRELYVELGTNEVMIKGRVTCVGIIHDVTEAHLARVALAQSEKRLRTVTDNVPVLIGYVGRDERYRFANRTYETWFDRPASAIVGQKVEAIHSAEAYAFVKPYIERALAGETVSFERETLSALPHYPKYVYSTFIPDVEPSGAVAGFHVLGNDITKSKLHEHALTRLAYHDGLTGLPNRRLFQDRLEQAMIRSHRHASLVALLYLDIDHFKRINDSMGHDTGDELLKVFAGRLQGAVRGADTVARIGGDEFTVIMEEVASADDAAMVAGKILAATRQPMQLGAHALSISGSIGIALFRADNTTRDEFIKLGDVALYRAKEQGRNGFAFANYPEKPGLSLIRC